mgnify:CR=1 FL=1
MKKVFLSTILMVSGVFYMQAQSNVSTVTQEGIDNEAKVEQEGTNNLNTITAKFNSEVKT